MKKREKYTLRAVCVDARGIYSKEVKVKYEIDLDVPDRRRHLLQVERIHSRQRSQLMFRSAAGHIMHGMPIRENNPHNIQNQFDMIEGNNVLSIILINESGQTSGVQKIQLCLYALRLKKP